MSSVVFISSCVANTITENIHTYIHINKIKKIIHQCMRTTKRLRELLIPIGARNSPLNGYVYDPRMTCEWPGMRGEKLSRRPSRMFVHSAQSFTTLAIVAIKSSGNCRKVSEAEFSEFWQFWELGQLSLDFCD